MQKNFKKVLGLDLGTNSIGWALIHQNFEEKYGKIIGLGSRIIPMSQDILGEFERGNSISQTAERTRLRSMRKLRERYLLRRERLHRILNVLGFLPEHYSIKIDFDKRVGKFLPETEVKFAYDGNNNFIFNESFNEMLTEFHQYQPEWVAGGKKVPYDWTIYYLRKKALTEKISNGELAWLLLHFNQKRGYYQLRGEEIEKKQNKIEEFFSLKVIDVTADEQQKGKSEIWYNIILENNWVYRRASKLSLFDWKNKTRDFIVTTDLNEDGSIKKDKEGKEKRSFRSPKEDDWQLLKTKTENEITQSGKTVGAYIYESLLQNPAQKIKGKLVRTIERKFYKDELKQILRKQIELNPLLQDTDLYQQCIEELYPHNLNHQSSLAGKGFSHLFMEDILYYQRPLRSQKGSISDCPLESRTFIHEGVKKTESIKCIPKSHPLYQEFRLWQWISNLRIINRENDQIETKLFLQSADDFENLFSFLYNKKDIDQKTLLKYLKLKESTYKWNYVEDKKYPCNETFSMIASRLEKVANVPAGFLTIEKELNLWHILYSVTDKIDYEKALKSFAEKNNLDISTFFESFRKFPPFESEYGSYSAKAIKKLLPLMRIGKYWDGTNIDNKTKERIDKIISAEYDDSIREKVREKSINLTEIHHFQGLPEWLAKYIVYDRHSESNDTSKWRTVKDLEAYLKSFKQHSLRNPIVEQVFTETIRVVKDIWQYYGNGEENYFDEIHIELGREMKNPADARKEMSSKNLINENTNLRIKALLAEMLNDNAVENVRPHSPMQQEALKIYEDAVLNGDIEIPEDIAKISKMAQPTRNELQKYKLWLEQKYRSPYTGEIIPLNKLFTPAFEIEHIIPQSRFFDDSFSNKVICETAINTLKGNQTGLEFIQNCGGQTVELGMGKTAKIFTEEDYTEFVKQNYNKNRSKKQKLMSLDIPERMVERQLNDTRYISKFTMHVLSNLVREEKNDNGINSKNILATNGQITSKLKQDWGLDAVWNDLILPRFERLNILTNSTHFTVYNERYQKYLPAVPIELQKGFQKKRLDHRHHAMDALVIACATRNHINYLNNQNALDKKKSKDDKQKDRYDLKVLLCDKRYNEGTKGNYNWTFKQPWQSFIPDAKGELEKVIVSFKQNLRIINKTVNYYEKIVDTKKVLIKQTKGDNWAIRKSLHTPMPYGKKKYNFDKLKISENLGKVESIIDPFIKERVTKILHENDNKIGETKKFLNLYPLKDSDGIDVISTAFTGTFEKFKRKQPISKLSNRGQGGINTVEEAINFINKITDKKIQYDLLNHLSANSYDIDIAFSSEGIEMLNANRKTRIYSVTIAESGSGRFSVGESNFTKHKWVEADKGTNLFLAIYTDQNGKRNFETIPLNEIIAHQIWRATLSKPEQKSTPILPIDKSKGDFIFFISPYDTIYLPEKDENINTIDFQNVTQKQTERIWMVNDFSTAIYFTPNRFSKAIMKKEVDLGFDKKTGKLKGSYDSKTASFEGSQIKDTCIKLNVDRLGHIKSVNK